MGRLTLLGAGGVGGYDEDAQLYFDQLVPPPSNTYKRAVNNFVISLKNDLNWNRLDRLWIHATEHRQHARVSLVNPTSPVITEVNAPTWAVNQGFTGNGASQYINTNYNPSVDGVNYTLNSGRVGVYSRTNNANQGIDIGAKDNAVPETSTQLSLKKGGVLNFYCNDNTGGTAINLTTTGFFASGRINNASIRGYKQGAPTASFAVASIRIIDRPLFLLAVNNSGVAAEFATRQIALSFAGSDSLDQASLYASVQALAVALGFNV